MDETRVVLDADFINEITDYESGDPEDLFRRLFNTLHLNPVVHSFVAEHELWNNRVASKLFADETLEKIELRELEADEGEDGEQLYRDTFEDFFGFLHPNDALPPQKDIFQRYAGHDFGEIHSIILASEYGIPLMYSNDHGAKDLAKKFAPERLSVLNAEQVAEELKGHDGITGSERRYIYNIYRRLQRENSRQREP